MSQSPPEPQSQPRPSQSLSEFVAKVLDQLSVSAWLPAALLVFAAWLLVELRANRGDLGQAFGSMIEAGWPTFLILGVGVVLATTVSQAFSFESIRLLEGYWGTGLVGRLVGDRRCRRHRAKRKRRADLLEEQRLSAFGYARMKMLAKDVDRPAVDIIERHEFPASPADAFLEPEHDWKAFADPDAIRRIHDLQLALHLYPVNDYRILPTELGNTLRSFEERALGGSHHHLESSVSSDFHRLPPNLQSEHDEQRSRLDLYCTLVVVSIALALVSVVMLGQFGLPALIALTLGLGASWFFYRAAIASAAGYGSVLIAIRTYLDSSDERHHRPEPSSSCAGGPDTTEDSTLA
jgi:hypothetical protein